LGKHRTKIEADFIVRDELQHVSKESRMSVDFGDLAPEISALDLDLASIAAGFFECEGLMRDGTINLSGELGIGVCQPRLATEEIRQILTDLLSFTLNRRPELRFHLSPNECASGSGKTGNSMKSICLFSGGIDSLSGILKIPLELTPTAGVFVSHDRMASCVKNLQETVLNQRKISVHKTTIQRNHSQLQQMRGFLYLTIGAVVAKLAGTRNIVISETGQTMFLPAFAALDEVTLTTHPTTIEITKSFLEESYGTKFDIFEPFADLTKAEVVALCGAKEAIPVTNSCRTTRFAGTNYSHCGTCYGCLVRRAACVVAGVKDALYGKDVLVRGVGDPIMGGWSGSSIKPKNLEDLRAFLRFSRDVLEDQLDEATRLKIESFSKEDLFRRFALDVMAALHLLYHKTKQGRNGWVKDFFEECLEDKVITADIVEDRIANVREQRRQPDFDTKI